jgi:hypothetical protein
LDYSSVFHHKVFIHISSVLFGFKKICHLLKRELSRGGGINHLGEMVTIKVLTSLMKDWNLPDNLKITWDRNDAQQVSRAEEVFKEYLKEGWLAFSEEADRRRQIFRFDAELNKIILIPPLGGG